MSKFLSLVIAFVALLTFSAGAQQLSPITGNVFTGVVNTFTANDFFSGGVPWIDVTAAPYSAVCNGSTDDTAALQAALTAAGSGGTVVFPFNKVCCVKTAGGITASGTGMHITYMAPGGGLLSTCGSLNQLLTINGDNMLMDHMSLAGAQLGAALGQNALTVGANCVRCLVQKNTITGGYYAIDETAGYAFFEYNNINGAVGPALVHVGCSACLSSGGNWTHNQIDQAWPIVPASGSLGGSPPAAWIASHAYTVGNVASDAGYYIQATACAGTCTSSSGAAPTLAYYGTSIIDNAGANQITWKLVAPTTFYSVLVDSNTNSLFMIENDATGPFSTGILLDRTLGGNVPATIWIDHCSPAQVFNFGIWIKRGLDVKITECQIGNVVQTGGAGIDFDANFSGDALVQANSIFATGTGVVLSSTAVNQNIKVIGNDIHGQTIGFFAAANVGHYINSLNSYCDSATYGANTIDISLTAGTSDYVNQTNNNTCGGTVTVGALSGTHNTIIAEGATGTSLPVLNTSPTIANPTWSGTQTTPFTGGGNLALCVNNAGQIYTHAAGLC